MRPASRTHSLPLSRLLGLIIRLSRITQRVNNMANRRMNPRPIFLRLHISRHITTLNFSHNNLNTGGAIIILSQSTTRRRRTNNTYFTITRSHMLTNIVLLNLRQHTYTANRGRAACYGNGRLTRMVRNTAPLMGTQSPSPRQHALW